MKDEATDRLMRDTCAGYLAYPFQNQVVNGHTGNLYATYRLINCQEKEPVEPSLAFLFGTDLLSSQHSYYKVLGRFSSVLIRVVDSGSHYPFRAATLSWKWRITRVFLPMCPIPFRRNQLQLSIFKVCQLVLTG